MARRTSLLVFLLFALGTILVQLTLLGTYGSELGAYSDEPAHYVTGVMVRDYASRWLTESPLRFAERFYDRYPKVALGNWPPGFYLLQAPWLLVVGDGPRLVLLYVTCLAALAATCLAALVARATSVPFGIVAAALWLSRPLTLALSGAVMTEVPLAFMTVVAISTWGAVSRRPDGRRAAWWGVLTGAAVLVKSSAIGLLAVPVLARGVNWRVRLAAVVGCLVLAAPWTVAFHAQARAGWLHGLPTWAYTGRAVPFYVTELAAALGWVGVAGLTAWGVSAVRSRTLGDSIERACVVVAAAWLGLMFVVPAGFEPRHVLPITVPCVVLSALGFSRLVADGRLRRPVVAVTLALLALDLVRGGLPVRSINGYREVVAIAAASCPPQCVLLVVSDPEGEGAVVAEAAARRRSVPLRVVRGSKVLSRSDWAGRGYRALVHTPTQARQLLLELGVTHVVLDEAPGHVADAAAGQLVGAALGATRARTVAVRRVVRHPERHLDDDGLARVLEVPRLLQ